MGNLRSVEHILLTRQFHIHLHIKLHINLGYSFLQHLNNFQLGKMLEKIVHTQLLNNLPFHRFLIPQRKYLESMKQHSFHIHLNGNLLRKVVLSALALQ